MTGNNTKRQLPIWATLLTLLGVAILCTLGTWQIQRLEWKTDILNKIAVENEKDPDQSPLNRKDFYTPNTTFKRGSIKGYFAHNKEIFLTPRTHNGKIGFHVLTPFILNDGTTILVNRGWHSGKDKKEHMPAVLKMRINGLATKPPRPNPFTPENTPEEKQWYWLDIEKIRSAYKLQELAPVIFYQEYYEQEKNILKPVNPAPPNNNHLQYAIFWFGMAGVLIIIYLLRFIIIKEKKEES